MAFTAPVLVGQGSNFLSIRRCVYSPRRYYSTKRQSSSYRMEPKLSASGPVMSETAVKPTMICTSLTATSVEGQLEEMRKALEDGANLAEIRLDYLTSDEFAQWRKLLTNKCLPVIVTNRASWEGGNWSGDENERLGTLVEAENLGAEYIDVELAACDSIKALRSSKSGSSKLILSHHNFTRPLTIDEVVELQRKMVLGGADVHKFAMMATSASDLCTTFKILQSARVPTIALAMGELGQASRVAAGKFGAHLTFASVGEGRESAPGQVSTRRLSEFFRFNKTSSRTRLFGIIGNPVSHSMSPAMHNAGMENAGINGLYVYVPVLDNVAGVVRELCATGFDGFSVTIPHKLDVLRAVDVVDSVAANIGAINTIVRNSDDTLSGYNTDWVAAMDAIDEGLERKSLSGLRVVCIGAGGAGRALAFGALSRGARQVVVVNRSADKAKSLAADLGESRAIGMSIEEFNASDDTNFDVIINSSSVGMHPNVTESPIPKSKLEQKPLVFDAVYNPLVTKLLQNATEMNCATVSGLEMFVRQGVEQFKLWHPQVDPPLDVMRSVVLEHLESKK